MSLLSLGWVVIALIALAVAIGATQVHQERMRLATLADELALAGANALEASLYEAALASGAVGIGPDTGAIMAHGPALTVARGDMHQAVTEHLELYGNEEWVGSVQVADVSSPDGLSASVTLVMTSRPLLSAPLLEHLWSGVRLTATATSRLD